MASAVHAPQDDRESPFQTAPAESDSVAAPDHQPPPTPQAVDLETIEREKENIVPLRKGRSATTLAHVFSVPDSARTSLLDTQRRQFEQEIEAAVDSDDPLDAHYRYIRWIVDNYPQGNNHESDLVCCVEKCTRRFRADERYRNDARYLRCWLMYADQVKEPRLIFQHLAANSIGQELGDFYEEYAAVLELEQRWKQAGDIFNLGINRRAEPLDRLRRRYQQFQLRYMAAMAKGVVDTGEPDESVLPGDDDQVQRSALQVLQDTRARTAQPAAVPPPTAPQPLNAYSNSQLNVYRDNEPTGLTSPPQQENASHWPELGTEQSRHKENRRDATRWQGQQITQRAPLRERSREKIKVYCDEISEPPTPARPKTPAKLTPHKQPSKQDLLISDPLRNFYSEDATAVAEPTAKRSATSAPTAASTAPAPAKKAKSTRTSKEKGAKVAREERMAAPLSLIMHNGQERSFEEARAAALGLLGAPFLTPPRPKRDALFDNSDADEPSKRLCQQVSSPTINTKVAMDDVMAMFNGPMNDDCSDSSFESAASPNIGHLTSNPPLQPSLTNAADVSSNASTAAPPKPSKISVFKDEDEPTAASTSSLSKQLPSRLLDVYHDTENEDDSREYPLPEQDDITGHLNMLRQQADVLPINQALLDDEDFTINFAPQPLDCSTPYERAVPQASSASIDEYEESIETKGYDDENSLDPLPYTSTRTRTAALPPLTPITEVSERSTFYGHSSKSDTSKSDTSL